MAIGLSEILTGIEIAWDIITATFEPLNAGETFTARPFAHVEGTYSYINSNGVWFDNQPAVFDYYDGEFSIYGQGEGSFSVTASAGDFSVGRYNAGGGIVYTRFDFGSGSGNYFGVSRIRDYKYSYRDVSTVYISTSGQLAYHKYENYPSDPFLAMNAYSDSSVSIGNVSGTGWDNLISDFVPLQAGTSYTYYDALDTYIDYFNGRYSDLNLTRNDFPPESDYLPQKPTTEPSGSGGFNIDYGEIMSPSEFDDVLNSAEYDLEEIPTTFALDLPDLPEETLPTGMLSLAGNIVNASYNYYDSLGLSGILISVGVIVCVIRFLRGR